MRPRKRFGQNFLQDKRVIQKIIAVIAPKAGQNIVEVGPGLGALTSELLPLVETMSAVELDRDLIPKLEVLCEQFGKLTVYSADVLKFDFRQLASTPHSLRVVGNLPYNISTPLIFHLLEQVDIIADMHFMLQKEVVERMSATVGNKAYGRLTVMVQYFCEVTNLFGVAPGAFYPAPQVDSAIVRLVPHREIALPVKNFKKFGHVVQQAFNQRRKTLRNSLKELITSEQLDALGIDPQLRPERLSVEDFVRITNSLEQES